MKTESKATKLRIEELLEIVPAELVEVYQRRSINTQSLAEMVQQYKGLGKERWWVFFRLLSLVGFWALVNLGGLLDAFFVRSFPFFIISTLVTILIGVLLLRRSDQLSMEGWTLKEKFDQFEKTICRLDPYSKGEVHAEHLTHRAVHDLLVQFAVNVIEVERRIKVMRPDFGYPVITLSIAINSLAFRDGEFTDLLSVATDLERVPATQDRAYFFQVAERQLDAMKT